jgi:hypothetical protein
MLFKPRFRLIGIMLLVSACSILAQESPPRLAGRVTQADIGAPIEGATVSLVPPMIMGQLNFQTAKTQSNGDYRFDQVRNGVYSITVSADGFVSQDYNRDAKRMILDDLCSEGANGPAGYGASSTPSPPYRETWFGGAVSREGAIPIAPEGGVTSEMTCASP